MAVKPLTAEQEAALSAASRLPVTAVAAGAGSGKTTLMVEAIWRDVEHEDIDLSRILVIAYNRAAAAHLAARLQARFGDLEDGRGSVRVGLDLSEGWVATFHSVGARMVREHPFAAGVDPNFGELDETESASLMEQALDEGLEEVLDAGDAPAAGFLELLATQRSSGGIRDSARIAHDSLRAAGMEMPALVVPEAPGPDANDIVELRRLIALAAAHEGTRDDHRRALREAELMLEIGRAGESVPRMALNCKATLRPLAEEFNEAAATVFQALVDVEAREQLLGFDAYLSAVSRRYAALKRERGALDYEDLLLSARRVLEGGAYDGHFARVYVDEYQDSNALQAAIVDLLKATRTVVVGDGCQAIYGFRHADSRHFGERANQTPGVSLRDNHRSAPALLEAMNDTLERALVDEPPFARLSPAAEDAPGRPPLAEPPLHIVDVRSGGEGKSTREQEAEVVANEVVALVERGYEHREIAIVFRALTAVEPYRAALVERGIPTHLVAGRGFFTHEQVADTIALLSLVENPYDEESLVRVLASPYVNADDVDLVTLRQRAGDGEPLWPAAGGADATAPAVDIVDALRPELRERGLAGLVEAAIESNGYELAVLGLADGARRYANLRQLVRMAAAHADVRGPDLRGFLALLRRQAEEANQDPGEATLVDPDLDAVRLSTIHGVKGQEFPAVVIADASHGKAGYPPMVIADRDGRAGIKISRVGGDRVAALGHDKLAETATEAEAAEERRVTYVAVTRAERHLAVVGRSDAGKRAEDGAFAVLSGGLHDGSPLLREDSVPEVESDGFRPRRVVPPSEPMAPAERLSERVADPLAGIRLSFSALQQFAVCPRRYHLEYELGLRGLPDTIIAAAGTGIPTVWGGAAFGDVVHRFLAEHDWSGAAPQEGWAASMATDLGLSESTVDSMRAERLVGELLQSPLAERIRSGEAPHPERRFAVGVDGVLLSGAIDLLVDEGEGRALLVDWKTHALDETRSAESVSTEYWLQQALYGLAALTAGYEEVALVWAILEDLDGSPERTVTAVELGTLEAEIQAAIDGIRAEARSPGPSKLGPVCSGCPGLQAMCPIPVPA